MNPFDKDWTKPEDQPQAETPPACINADFRHVGLPGNGEGYWKGVYGHLILEADASSRGEERHYVRDLFQEEAQFLPYEPHPEDGAALAYKANLILDLHGRRGWRVFYSTDPQVIGGHTATKVDSPTWEDWYGNPVTMLEILPPEFAGEVTVADIIQMKEDFEKFHSGLERHLMLSGMPLGPTDPDDDQPDTPIVIEDR